MVDYLTPLTQTDIDEMNAAALDYGETHRVSLGETRDLAQFFRTKPRTCRRWFSVASSTGLVEKRHLVPTTIPKGFPGGAAIDRRIRDMYPDVRTARGQRLQAPDVLRYRCILGACLSEELTRDPLFHGQPFTQVDHHPTLSVCLEEVQKLLIEQYGEHGHFMARAWTRVTIRRRTTGGLPWVLTIFCAKPDYGRETSDPQLED